jgi:hypothetical protein
MANVYYSPEDFGLTVVDELSKDPDYDFDMLVVWRHEDGTLYWAHDSGCSCPTPFEDYNRLSDLYVLKDTLREFRQAMDYMYGVSEEDKIKFLQKFGA